MEARETSGGRLSMSMMMFLFFHFLTSFMKRATACSGFVDLENYPRDS